MFSQVNVLSTKLKDIQCVRQLIVIVWVIVKSSGIKCASSVFLDCTLQVWAPCCVVYSVHGWMHVVIRIFIRIYES